MLYTLEELKIIARQQLDKENEDDAYLSVEAAVIELDSVTTFAELVSWCDDTLDDGHEALGLPGSVVYAWSNNLQLSFRDQRMFAMSHMWDSWQQGADPDDTIDAVHNLVTGVIKKLMPWATPEMIERAMFAYVNGREYDPEGDIIYFLQVKYEG